MHNRSKNIFSLLTGSLAVLMVFAAVATAATINDDDIGHVLKGTNSVDTINGNGGNDTINAKNKADVVDAGTGNDTVNAGAGNDTVQGGDGDDLLRGGLGADKQYGGAGNDTIFANKGRDESWGGAGNDTLWALARSDVRNRPDFRGDVLHGEDGDDVFRTRDGEGDTIDCGAGIDTAILDHKDKIVDATTENPKGSCEDVVRKARNASDIKEPAAA
ncbi:MAG: calcium-binding protein [Solirubrobacterales bacterium]